MEAFCTEPVLQLGKDLRLLVEPLVGYESWRAVPLPWFSSLFCAPGAPIIQRERSG